MPKPRPLKTLFYRSEAGNEPVREWLKALSKEEMKTIGTDILAVQMAWPIGKPLVDSLGQGLWEVRSSLGSRIARVFFIVEDEEIVLLHGFIKKTQKAPADELKLARSRQARFLAHVKNQAYEKGNGKRKSPPGK